VVYVVPDAAETVFNGNVDASQIAIIKPMPTLIQIRPSFFLISITFLFSFEMGGDVRLGWQFD